MKTALLWFQRLFLVCSVAFLVIVFVQNREDVFNIFSTASYTGLMLAILFWIIATLFMPAIAHTILSDRGNSVSFKTLLWIHLNRIPSKFLPGGVWQTFARAYDMNSMGVSKTDISLVVLYENSYSIILAAMVSTLGIYLLDENGLYSSLALILFCGCITTIPLAIVLRKRSFILSSTAYLRLTSISILFWILASCSFYAYVRALGLVSPADDGLLTVMHYLFSYVVGFVSIFAPQGIGVFEVVFAELSEFDIPLTQAIVFIAGFRILVMLSDMITWLGFVLVRVSRGVGASLEP